MAMLSQCFSYYCCMESLGKLPPKRFGHHMVNVSAILRILFWGCQSRGVNLGRGGGQRLFRPPRDRRRQHTGRAATPATGFHRLFLCFSFLGGGVWRPVAPVAGLPPCVLTRSRGTNARGAETGCGGRRQHTEGSLQRRTGGDGRCTGIAAPVPRSNGGRRCAAQLGGPRPPRRRGSGCSAARRSQGA